MITWPAIIKYAGEDELGYVADLTQWRGDAELHSFDYEPMDILIDSTGLIQHLNRRNNDFITEGSTTDIIDLARATELVKAHFSSMGSCCVAKISARSVAQLIEFVGFDSDGR